MGILTRLFGTRNEKILNSFRPWLQKINDLEKTLQPQSDEALRALSFSYRERLSRGESLDQILPEAYATCREVSKRVLGQRHYDVQLLGGIMLHGGHIAEMKTGEGKTLTATLPAYLHGLSGKGAHVVTVNDYLAKRDAEWMGTLYRALGMDVDAIVHGLSDGQRKMAYQADITYATNNELGFDFLRDNMKTMPDRLVQRGHNFAIVDEVDSILIDEARTPLIISGPTDTNTELYKKVNTVLPGIKRDIDYTVDEKNRTVSLTEDGISKMEKRLNLDNLYDPQHIEWLHHIQQALKAHVLFKKDVDYVVRDSEIIIVDEFTGRLMPGRRYSDGLHGALEAKEHVAVQQETQTLATITFQNYFRLYSTLSGMTGTADTEAVEFKKIYNLDVVVIPTNKKLIRDDQQDVIYRTAREKYTAIAEEITEAHKKEQPVLVGTVSVEKSELLSNLLTKMSVPHEVLNAKNHAREAAIIADAGKKGHITIATNMAGRGTDIVLGEGVAANGGLYVISTERHESRRIDNQLRGRAGRQGDPGKSKFFLSLEDDLMRIFASDRLSAIMQRLGMEEGEAIISPMVTRAIEKAQKRVEEQNFSSRKNLLEYDDVMNQQRQVVYKRRSDALMGHSDLPFLPQVIEELVSTLVQKHSPEALDAENWDFAAIHQEIHNEFHLSLPFTGKETAELSEVQIVDQLTQRIEQDYLEKMSPIPVEDRKKIENFVYLQLIDKGWKDHLLGMDALKDSVSLRGYGQRDPLQEYKKEAFTLFTSLISRIEVETTLTLVRMPRPEPVSAHPQDFIREEETHLELQHPEATALAALHEEASSSQEEEDRLVYHQRPQAEEKTAVQTYRRDSDKVGRNDLCPCGSGKKYKKCHGVGAI